jgi:hypothetical protein
MRHIFLLNIGEVRDFNMERWSVAVPELYSKVGDGMKGMRFGASVLLRWERCAGCAGNNRRLTRWLTRRRRGSRNPSFGGAMPQVMKQGVDTSLPNVSILFVVPATVEERTRISPFRCSVIEIMPHGINASGFNIGVMIKIPIAVKQIGGLNQLDL